MHREANHKLHVPYNVMAWWSQAALTGKASWRKRIYHSVGWNIPSYISRSENSGKKIVAEAEYTLSFLPAVLYTSSSFLSNIPINSKLSLPTDLLMFSYIFNKCPIVQGYRSLSQPLICLLSSKPFQSSSCWSQWDKLYSSDQNNSHQSMKRALIFLVNRH